MSSTECCCDAIRSITLDWSVLAFHTSISWFENLSGRHRCDCDSVVRSPEVRWVLRTCLKNTKHKFHSKWGEKINKKYQNISRRWILRENFTYIYIQHDKVDKPWWNQTYISYMEDTHQILFGSANSFKSYCVHMKSPRTYIQTSRRTDGQAGRQTEIFFGLFCLLRHTNHENLSKGENFFFPLMRLQYVLFLHTPYVMRK